MTSDFIYPRHKDFKILIFFAPRAVISDIAIKVRSPHLTVKMSRLFRVRRFLKQQSNLKFEIVETSGMLYYI